MAETDARDGDLPIEAVMAALRVSKRTVQRYADAWGIAKRQRPQKGAPPVTVYDPADVARVAVERTPAVAVHVLSADPTGNGNGRGLQPHNNGIVTPPADGASGHLAAALEVVLLRLLQSPPTSPPALPPSPPVAETRYLTLDEAAAFTGLTATFLTRMIKRGTLSAIKDRGWKIRRKDLEAL